MTGSGGLLSEAREIATTVAVPHNEPPGVIRRRRIVVAVVLVVPAVPPNVETDPPMLVHSSPVSVKPSPPADNPPRCRSGPTMMAEWPMRTACTAAATPADVGP